MSNNFGISCSIWGGGGAALGQGTKKRLDTLTGQERGRCSPGPPKLRLTSDQSITWPLGERARGWGLGGRLVPAPSLWPKPGFLLTRPPRDTCTSQPTNLPRRSPALCELGAPKGQQQLPSCSAALPPPPRRLTNLGKGARLGAALAAGEAGNREPQPRGPAASRSLAGFSLSPSALRSGANRQENQQSRKLSMDHAAD